MNWQCEECGCKSYAVPDEQKSNGSFGPSNIKRCLDCKLDHQPPKTSVSLAEIKSYVRSSIVEDRELNSLIEMAKGCRVFLTDHPDIHEDDMIRLLGTSDVVSMKSVVAELLSIVDQMSEVIVTIGQNRKWMPIESAPTDYTHVIGMDKNGTVCRTWFWNPSSRTKEWHKVGVAGKKVWEPILWIPLEIPKGIGR